MKNFRTPCVGLSILSLVATLTGGATLRAEPAPLNLGEAIKAQQRLIDKNPQSATLHNDLGNLLYLDGQPQAAEQSYEASIGLDPELVSVRYNLGLLLQQTERPRRAERQYKKVLKADPEHAWAHYQSGVVFAQRGRRSAAIRSYARAMRLNPRITDPAFNPHIVENALASSAILLAYADLSSAALAPRIYESADDVTRLLLAAQSGMPHPEKSLQRRNARKRARQARKADSK